MRVVLLIVFVSISIICFSQETQVPAEAPTGLFDQTNVTGNHPAFFLLA
jgi:hypothetical protein